MQILIVEDDYIEASVSIRVISKLTSRLDWKILACASLARALESIPSSDLAFVDLMLPDALPEETVERLVLPFASTKPIVIITSSDSGGLKRMCLEAGVVDWIDKSKLRPSMIEEALVRAVHVCSDRGIQHGIEVMERSAERLERLHGS